MRKEPVVMVRAAPRGDRYLRNAEVAGLLHENRPQIDMLRFGLGRRAELHRHLGTDLVTFPTNAYPTMHYDILSSRERLPLEDFDAAFEHAPRDATPSRVQ
jgi:hypothetical protein